MANFIYEIAPEFTYANITIYRILQGGELDGWRVNANEGYVFYDTTEEHFDLQKDPETGLPMFDENGNPIEIRVNHYFREAYLPINYNFDNFPYIAVVESEVDEDYIFGGGDNNPK